MTNILENSLILVALTLLVVIPVFIVRRNNKRKKQLLLQSELEKISADNNFKLIHSDEIGKLLIAFSDSRKLLLLNLLDFVYEIIDLEKVIHIKEDLSYNGKEVKNVKLLLKFNNGVTKDISFYKQYDDSERGLSTAKQMAGKWSSLLTPAE